MHIRSSEYIRLRYGLDKEEIRRRYGRRGRGSWALLPFSIIQAANNYLIALDNNFIASDAPLNYPLGFTQMLPYIPVIKLKSSELLYSSELFVFILFDSQNQEMTSVFYCSLVILKSKESWFRYSQSSSNSPVG